MAQKSLSLKSWTRQEDETSPAFEAFVGYRDMGSRRSVPALARQMDCHTRHLFEWSKKFQWPKRCHAWEAHLDKAACATQVAEIIAMKKRQIRLALHMQGLAKEALDLLNEQLDKAREEGKSVKSVITADNIVRMIDVGSKLERLNHDEPSRITKVQDEDFSHLSLDDMLLLRKLLQKGPVIDVVAD